MNEDVDFEPEKYVQRPVDDELWQAYANWRSNNSSQGRIYLQSAPGRGNSWALKHFRYRVDRSGALGVDTCLIYVDADESTGYDGEPADLNPVANAVYLLHRKLKQQLFQRLWEWLKGVNWKALLFRWLCISVILALMFIVVSLLESKSPSSMADWSTAVRKSLQDPRQIILEVLLAILALPIAEWIKPPSRRRSKEKTEREREEELQLKESYRKYDEGLVGGLRDVSKSTICILLVDNAEALGDEEREFLNNLTGPSYRPSFGEHFTHRQRILVVWLERTENEQPGLRAEGTQEGKSTRVEIHIPKFTRSQLVEIAEGLNVQRGSPEEFEQCLDSAEEQTVKALFLEQGFELRKRIESEWEKSNAFDTRFDQSDLRAIYATTRMATITTDALLETVNQFDLGAIYPTREPDYRDEVKEFSRSGSALFRLRGDRLISKGRHLAQDLNACRKLRRLLEESESGRKALSRAHYWWFASLIEPIGLGEKAPENVGFSGNDEVLIRRAAWHLLQLGMLACMDAGKGDSIPDAAHIVSFFSTTRLKSEEQLVCRHKAVAALVLTTKFRLAAGRPEAAREAAQHALAWLGQDDSARRDWFGFTARTFWLAYWISFDAGIRVCLKTLGENNSEFLSDLNWRICEQYEELLKGKFMESQLCEPPSGGDADLTNIWRLTSFLREVRTKQGFIRKALEDSSIEVPEPIQGEDALWAEFMLLHMRALAAILRSDGTQMEEALKKIKVRLDARPQLFAAHTAFHYLTGRYNHLKLDELKALEADRSKAPAERTTEDSSRGDLQAENLAAMANMEYASATVLALRLGYRAFLLDAEFWHGELLWDHGQGKASPASNELNSWEEHFSNCIGLEKDAGWQLHTPAIYRIRYKFAERVDKSASIQDAFNMLESARRAGYPNGLVLKYHKETGNMVTNYGNESKDRRIFEIGAELEIAWAKELAELPEAMSERTFPQSLPLERASSYHFAAQNERLAGHLNLAEEYLDEALKHLNGAQALPETGQGETDSANFANSELGSSVNRLYLQILLQKSWILSSKSGEEASAESQRVLYEVWRKLSPGHQFCTNVLSSIVTLEDKAQTLRLAWSSMDDQGLPIDEGNPGLSLPAANFQHPDALGIRNRFHYRLLQMLWFGCKSIAPDASFLQYRILLAQSENRRNPTAAIDNSVWNGQDQFGAAILHMAEIEIEGSYLDSERQVLLLVLDTVTRVYEASGAAEPAIRGYRLLINFDPGQYQYQTSYVAVVQRHREYLQRALLARFASGTGWYAAAVLFEELFRPVTDQKLVQSRAGKQLTANHISGENYNLFQTRLREALPEAHKLSGQGYYQKCMGMLESFVAQISSRTWIQLPQLEALDLWLRCARAGLEVNDPSPAESATYDKRAALQRQMTQDFFIQSRETTDSPEMQQFAMKLAFASGPWVKFHQTAFETMAGVKYPAGDKRALAQ
jgi:hypothetical protein